MDPRFCVASLMGVLLILGSMGQKLPEDFKTPARALDGLLRDHAFRAFDRLPLTGDVYDGSVPENLSGIAVAALRLRSGSLFRRGFSRYKEFAVPSGVVVQPYAERVVLVYQNLGNLSSFYYPLAVGYRYLAPVVGLLLYDGSDLSSGNAKELEFVASESPITVNFTNASPAPDRVAVKCVWFDPDGVGQFRDTMATNLCSMSRRGHVGLVVNLSTGSSSGRKGSSFEVWKIASCAAGGFVGFVLVALLLLLIARHRKNRKLKVMEHKAEVGEALQMANVRNTKAPVAPWIRTQPVLEKEYTA